MTAERNPEPEERAIEIIHKKKPENKVKFSRRKISVSETCGTVLRSLTYV